VVSADSLALLLPAFLDHPISLKQQQRRAPITAGPQNFQGFSFRLSNTGNPILWISIQSMTSPLQIELDNILSLDVSSKYLEIKWKSISAGICSITFSK
jgi:hypothetical protein